MSELESLRGELEGLSLDLLALLNRRAERALAVARTKQQLGLPIRDPYRESQLLDRLAAANQGPLDEATVRVLFRHVVDACVSLMEDRRRRALQIGPGAERVAVAVRGYSMGGDEPIYIAGPCSLESEAQVEESARRLAGLGVRFFRGGAFKPRTSPYAFQGHGERALRWLHDAARRHDLVTITEATSPGNVQLVAAYADVIQIGARNMYNYELLRAAGRTGKPVLLKRSFSASLDEWLNAAEYVALAGSEQVILCERGVRGFGRETRATLDLSSVPLALAASRLPVIVDVSHAAGRRDLLLPLTRAAFAVGAQAVMLEVHPDPDLALSDGEQQLTIEDFAALVRAVAKDLQRTATQLGAAGECQSNARLGVIP